MAKQITLTQGKCATVDDDDFEYLNQWKWFAKKHKTNYYAERIENNKKIKMHRLIMGVVDHKTEVDHRDRNSLNNQRNNLRLATRSQNNANRSSHKDSSSKYLGVSIHVSKRNGKERRYWIATIVKNYKRETLGLFKVEEDAALAYNKRAIELHGEFANLNIIKQCN